MQASLTLAGSCFTLSLFPHQRGRKNKKTIHRVGGLCGMMPESLFLKIAFVVAAAVAVVVVVADVVFPHQLFC